MFFAEYCFAKRSHVARQDAECQIRVAWIKHLSVMTAAYEGAKAVEQG